MNAHDHDLGNRRTNILVQPELDGQFQMAPCEFDWEAIRLGGTLHMFGYSRSRPALEAETPVAGFGGFFRVTG